MTTPPTSNTSATVQPVCLVVIDGWGISPTRDPSKVEGEKCASDKSSGSACLHPNLLSFDAIRTAHIPHMNKWLGPYADNVHNQKNEMEANETGNKGNHSTVLPLLAHGTAVGLPAGLMGNSEVGHLNLGAGRIVYQDIVRIDLAIAEDHLDRQEGLLNALRHAKDTTQRIHFIGLVSDGGVHSHQKHLYDMLRVSKRAGIKDAFVHFIGDGRDTSPMSAHGYAKELLDKIKELNYGQLASVVGRYYAMDRDKRWERTQQAYDLYMKGDGEASQDILETINMRYEAGETDEFLKPISICKDGIVKENDTVVFFNYRSDRMRQIVLTFLDSQPLPFESIPRPKNLNVVGMTQYNKDYEMSLVFPPQSMENVLAEALSNQAVRQCHIAETEKYAHVTFFFNGGREASFKDEDRIMVPSPKVPTYDLLPEMSCAQVADQVCLIMAQKTCPFIMCNLAPPDMVGHTGVYEAAVKAVEATDLALKKIEDKCKEMGYVLFITADHGNAEKMKDEQGRPHTAHTTSTVPFIMLNAPNDGWKLDQEKARPGNLAALCDVAPTILATMNLSIPAEMTGSNLLLK